MRVYLVLFSFVFLSCVDESLPSHYWEDVNNYGSTGVSWERSDDQCLLFSFDAHAYPGDDIQSIVDSLEAGSVIKIGSGIHKKQSIQPKDDMVFIGVKDSILNGGGEVDFAFYGNADNVFICGLTIEDYVPGRQMGAIKAGDHSSDRNTNGWTIKNSEVRHNFGGGIRIGNRMRVINNFVHHNYQIGIVGGGDDVVIERNEISFNNFQEDFDYTWEAGGTKFVKTRNLIIRNNFVHHNWGPGLWTDIDNIDTLMENNIVEDNAGSGIFHEISYAATIRENTVRRNGYDRVGSGWAYGAGIIIAHSPNVEVYDNVVVDNHNGIVAIQQKRLDGGYDNGEGRHGPYVLDNIKITNNTIIQMDYTSGWTVGVFEDMGDRSVYSRNIFFDRNTYILNKPRLHSFNWYSGSVTWNKWQSYGHDQNSSLN